MTTVDVQELRAGIVKHAAQLPQPASDHGWASFARESASKLVAEDARADGALLLAACVTRALADVRAVAFEAAVDALASHAPDLQRPEQEAIVAAGRWWAAPAQADLALVAGAGAWRILERTGLPAPGPADWLRILASLEPSGPEAEILRPYVDAAAAQLASDAASTEVTDLLVRLVQAATAADDAPPLDWLQAGTIASAAGLPSPADFVFFVAPLLHEAPGRSQPAEAPAPATADAEPAAASRPHDETAPSEVPDTDARPQADRRSPTHATPPADDAERGAANDSTPPDVEALPAWPPVTADDPFAALQASVEAVDGRGAKPPKAPEPPATAGSPLLPRLSRRVLHSVDLPNVPTREKVTGPALSAKEVAALLNRALNSGALSALGWIADTGGGRAAGAAWRAYALTRSVHVSPGGGAEWLAELIAPAADSDDAELRLVKLAVGIQAAVAGHVLDAAVLSEQTAQEIGGPELAGLVDAVRDAAARIGALTPALAVEAPAVADQRERLLALADDAAAELEQPRTFNFARASLLWERWIDPRSDRLGTLLATVARLRTASPSTPAYDEALERIADITATEAYDALRTPSRIKRQLMADDEALRGNGSEPIVGQAFSQLHRRGRAIFELCARAAAIAETLRDVESPAPVFFDDGWAESLRRAARQVRAQRRAVAATTPARRALSDAIEALVALVLDGVGEARPAIDDLWVVTDGAILTCPDAPVEPDAPGSPGGGGNLVLKRNVLERMLSVDGSEFIEAAHRRAEQLEFDLAELALAAARHAGEDVAQAKAEIRTAQRAAVDALRADATAVKADVERGWALGYLEEDDWRDLLARVDAVLGGLEVPDLVDRMTAERAQLREIIRHLAVSRDARASRLRDEVAVIVGTGPHAAAWREHVEAMIAAGDLASAEELLAGFTPDDRPPEMHRADGLPGLNALAAADALPELDPHAVVEAITHGQRLGELDFGALSTAERGQAAAAATAWFAIADAGGVFPSMDAGMKARLALDRVILPAIGLQPEKERPSDANPFPLARALRAKLTGGRAIPAFGSDANGSYRLHLGYSHGAINLENVVRWTTAPSGGTPVIALLFGRLDRSDRAVYADLVRRDRGRWPSALIDTSSFLAILAHGVGDFGATMDVTAPFANLNPYTPDQPGYVPSEVFYGREAEIRDVLGNGGEAIGVLYGGRRLGKTALLTEAHRRADAPDSHVRVVYVDALSELSRWPIPSDMPGLLHRIFNDTIGASRPRGRFNAFERFQSAVVDWLGKQPAHQRLVFLIDEADAFLDADAARDFEVTARLEGLTLDRRIRVVFVGLHQVQRFNAIRNARLQRFGRSVGIGPLDLPDAVALIVEPLARVGYVFRDVAPVHRLLSASRRHPGLIQICCYELVREMQRRLAAQATDALPPYEITVEVVDAVLSHARTGSEIHNRLDQTLTLDPRYRIITLLLARDAQDQGRGMLTTELRRDCDVAWAIGFFEIDEFEFEALLTELADLDVIARHQNGRWRLSSPNWLRLFGSRGSLERQLAEAGREPVERFEGAYQRRPLEGVNLRRRSALSEAETEAIWQSTGTSRIIIGSPAVHIGRVADSLTLVAKETDGLRQLRVWASAIDAPLPDLRARAQRQIQSGGEAVKAVVLHADHLSGDEVLSLWQDTQTWAAGDGRSPTDVRCTILARPTVELFAARRALESSLGVDVPLSELRSWGLRDLYNYPDTDSGLPARRDPLWAELLHRTGGWPALIERVLVPDRRIPPMSLLRQRMAQLNAWASSEQGARELIAAVGLRPGPHAGALEACWDALVKYGEGVGFRTIDAFADDLAMLLEIADHDIDLSREERRDVAACLRAMQLLKVDDSTSMAQPERVAAGAWSVATAPVVAS